MFTSIKGFQTNKKMEKTQMFNNINMSDNYLSKSNLNFKQIIEVDDNGNEIPLDSRAILGVVEGIFFVPDGQSRNGRVYTKEFWQYILSLEDVKYRLKNGLMYGAIGHKDEPVSDDDLNEGKVSHLVVDLWINENSEGCGRAVVLNTESGRLLMTYLRANSKLKVSSRAVGNYKENVFINGLPVVDEKSYYLDTFDFVKDPGFLQAKPNLVKDLESNYENFKPKGEGKNEMLTEEQVKSLISTGIQEGIKNLSNSTPTNAIEEKINLKNENSNLKNQLDSLKKEVSFLEKFNPIALATLKELANEGKTEFINQWNELGNPDDINESIDRMESHIPIYNKFLELESSPESLVELLKISNEKADVLNTYESIGKPETFEGFTEIVENLAKFIKINGSLEKISNVLDVTKVKFNKYENAIVNLNRRIIEMLSKDLSNRFDKPLEEIRESLKKYGEKETIKLLNGNSKFATYESSNNNKNKETKNSSRPLSSAKNLAESLNGEDSKSRPAKMWDNMYNGKTKGVK